MFLEDNKALVSDLNEIMYKCPKCGLEHEQKYFLKHHRRVHGGIPEGFENDMKFPCKKCSESFQTATHLSQHVYRHHPIDNLPEILHCHLCNTSLNFKTPGMLISHYRKEHGGAIPPMFENNPKFICSQCPNIYPSEKSLKAHIHHKHRRRIVENKAAKIERCAYCGKVFQNKSRLSTHVLNIHENSGAFPCETCNRKFPSESTLFDHVKLVHTKVSCELCNEVLYNKFYLKRHKAAVHGIIPQDSFKCIACPMFFKAEKSLISHVKSKH